MDREKVIVRTSIIGILANLFLVAFKAAVGFLSGSIAVMLDAVNNLSDALSSVITIVGTKLAAKKPDKKHPLGYGRIEYLTAMIVAAIVLYAGITSLVESVKSLFSGDTPEYSVVSLIIIAAAVVVKLLLGAFVKREGKRVNSGSLIASGSDATFDAVLSASVLASALIFTFTGFSLEAWVGLVISGFIIKSGIEMLTETLDDILGKRTDPDTARAIKDTVKSVEGVQGAYDLFLNSYGPDTVIGSVHIEVPDTMTADEIDALERTVYDKVFCEHGVALTGIGIYSVNTKDDEAKRLRTEVNRIVLRHEGVLQTHGFYVDAAAKTVNLDILIGFEVEDRRALFEEIRAELQKAYPDYAFTLAMDLDV